MSREDIIAVAARLFAIFLFVAALRAAAQVLSVLGTDTSGYIWWALASTVAPLAIAALLWRFPLTVAHKLLPVMRNSSTPISPETTDLIEIGCTLVGLWLLATAISNTFYWSVLLIISFKQGVADSLAPEHISAILTTFAELLIALWLILGYRGILGAIRRIRTAGQSA